MADSSSHASEASELNSQGVESASNMARRVLEMPDWAKVEEDYLKSVRNGRHPISFKRKGELWYHCDTTNQRLARVSKGHKLAHVLNENKYYASEDGGGGGLSGQELLELARGSSLDAASTDSPSLTQSLSSAGSKAGSRQTTARATPANPTTSVRSPVRMRYDACARVSACVHVCMAVYWALTPNTTPLAPPLQREGPAPDRRRDGPSGLFPLPHGQTGPAHRTHRRRLSRRAAIVDRLPAQWSQH